MDVTQVRHANLLARVQLLEQRGVKLRKDQAQALGGLGSSYLSQLIAGKKMGDDVARKIDSAICKPRGWMDQVHPDGSNVVTSADKAKSTGAAFLSSPIFTESPSGRRLVRALTRAGESGALDEAMADAIARLIEALPGAAATPIADEFARRARDADPLSAP